MLLKNHYDFVLLKVNRKSDYIFALLNIDLIYMEITIKEEPMKVIRLTSLCKNNMGHMAYTVQPSGC